MATPAQIAANRANAQRSTGPRTEEGKAKIRQNALRHGLCSAVPLMSDETNEEVQELLDALREEFLPVGPNEEILVYKMAEHFFYGKRAAYLLSEQLDSNDGGDDNAREIGLMMRYHTASDRGYYRALNELRKVQKERRCPRVQSDATTSPSTACSQAPLLILPTNEGQREDTGQEPRAMERDRSIGSVSQPAETASEDCLPKPAAPEGIGFVSQTATSRPAEASNFVRELGGDGLQAAAVQSTYSNGPSNTPHIPSSTRDHGGSDKCRSTYTYPSPA
jgi:hypothetical protein